MLRAYVITYAQRDIPYLSLQASHVYKPENPSISLEWHEDIYERGIEGKQARNQEKLMQVMEVMGHRNGVISGAVC